MNRFIVPSFLCLLMAGCNVGPAASTDTAPAATSGATNDAGATAVAAVAVTNSTPAAPLSAASPSGTPALAASTDSTSTNSAASFAVPKPPPELPVPVAEVVRLAQHTIGETILIDYVNAIQEPYTLSADQLIYLHDLGVTPNVMQALLKHVSGPVPMPTAPAGPGPEMAQESAASGILTNGLATGDSGALLTNYLNSALAGPPGSLGPVQTPAHSPEAMTAPPPPAPAIAAATPQPPVESSMVYDSLSPYGDWVETPDYGWAWQPTVAVIDTNWHPYMDSGNWMWTDAGWYWNSTYSWGWLPFHYGRWGLSANRGWVWVPDTVWAPAWVTWRYTDAVCGWAPLPPGAYWTGVGMTFRGGRVGVGFDFGLTDMWFCAAPYGRFCDPWLPRYCLPRPSVSFFVSNSRPLNNVHGSSIGVRGSGTLIVNNGPGVAGVQAATRQEVVRHNLHDLPAPGAGLTLPSRPSPAVAGGSAKTGATATGASGGAVGVYRHEIPQPTAQPPSSVLARQENRTVAGTTFGGTKSAPAVAPIPFRGTQGTMVSGSASLNAGRGASSSSAFVNGVYRPAPLNYSRSEPVQAGRPNFASQTSASVPQNQTTTWQRPPVARPTVQPYPRQEVASRSEPVRNPADGQIQNEGYRNEPWAPSGNANPATEAAIRPAVPNNWQPQAPAYARPNVSGNPNYAAQAQAQGGQPSQPHYQPSPQPQPTYAAPAHSAPPAVHYSPPPSSAPAPSSSQHSGGGNGRNPR